MLEIRRDNQVKCSHLPPKFVFWLFHSSSPPLSMFLMTLLRSINQSIYLNMKMSKQEAWNFTELSAAADPRPSNDIYYNQTCLPSRAHSANKSMFDVAADVGCISCRNCGKMICRYPREVMSKVGEMGLPHSGHFEIVEGTGALGKKYAGATQRISHLMASDD